MCSHAFDVNPVPDSPLALALAACKRDLGDSFPLLRDLCGGSRRRNGEATLASQPIVVTTRGLTFDILLDRVRAVLCVGGGTNKAGTTKPVTPRKNPGTHLTPLCSSPRVSSPPLVLFAVCTQSRERALPKLRTSLTVRASVLSDGVLRPRHLVSTALIHAADGRYVVAGAEPFKNVKYSDQNASLSKKEKTVVPPPASTEVCVLVCCLLLPSSVANPRAHGSARQEPWPKDDFLLIS
jgi:hypothetical protein